MAVKLDKHLQRWKGSIRVRIAVPANCRDRLPAPFHGRRELLHTLDSDKPSIANKLAAPVKAHFFAMIDAARPVPSRWVPFTYHERQLLSAAMPQPTVAAGYYSFSREPEHGRTIDVTPAPPAYVPLDSLLDLWAEKKPKTPDVAAVENCRMVFRHFRAWLGHDDAAQVTPDNATDYLDNHLLKTKTQPTAQKYLAYVKAVFAHAKTKRKLTGENPFAEVSFTAKKDPRKKRQDFAMAEVARMVKLARLSDDQMIRIVYLMDAYCGARRAEIVEAHKRDFEIRDDGTIIFHVRLENRPETMRIKNEVSERRFPLHPAIVDDVRAYLATIPDGMAFPQLTLDPKGRLSKNAGTALMKWLRETAEITEPRKVFHSFRHTFKTALRNFCGDEETRNRITGHETKGEGSNYGEFAIAAMIAAMAALPADPMAWKLDR